MMKIFRLLHQKLLFEKMPDAVVGYYEKLIDGVKDIYLGPFVEQVLKTFPGPARILDIGTGTGQLPIMLAKANRNYQLTAADISRKYLEVASSKANLAGVGSRITFNQIDISRDQWDVEPFDLIVSTCSMHHWRQPVLMLKNAEKLLRKQGQIWVLDDVAEVSSSARRAWIKKVEESCHPGLWFKIVFRFESKFIAYSRSEVEGICETAGLKLADFSTRDAFFFAKITCK